MSGRQGAAMRRVAGCTVRALGAGAVTLKMPVAAAAGDAEQLGLVEPQFSDLVIAQAVVRAGGVVMSADAVRAALKLSDDEAVLKALGETGGVVADGDWMTVVGVEAVRMFGVVCLYRLRLA